MKLHTSIEEEKEFHVSFSQHKNGVVKVINATLNKLKWSKDRNERLAKVNSLKEFRANAIKRSSSLEGNSPKAALSPATD